MDHLRSKPTHYTGNYDYHRHRTQGLKQSDSKRISNAITQKDSLASIKELKRDLMREVRGTEKNLQDSLRIVEKIDYLTKYQSKPSHNELRASNSHKPTNQGYQRRSNRDYFLNNDGSLMSQLNSTSNYDKHKNGFYGLLSTLQEESQSLGQDLISFDNLSKVGMNNDPVIKPGEARCDRLNIGFNTINEFSYDNVRPIDVNVRGELNQNKSQQIQNSNYSDMNFKNSQTSEESQSRIRNLMLKQERMQKHETDFSDKFRKLKESLQSKSFKNMEEENKKNSVRMSYDYSNSSDLLPNELMDKFNQLEYQQSLKILNSYKNIEDEDNSSHKDNVSQFQAIIDNYQSNYNSNQSNYNSNQLKNWGELNSLNYCYGSDKDNSKASSKREEDKVQLSYSMSTDEKEGCLYELKPNGRCQSDQMEGRSFPTNADFFAVKSMKNGTDPLLESLSGRELEKKNENIFGLSKHREEHRESMDFNAIWAKASKKHDVSEPLRNAFKKNKQRNSKQLDSIPDEYKEANARQKKFMDLDEGDKKFDTNSDNHLMNMDFEFSKRKVNKSEKNSFMKEAFFSFKPEEDI